MSEQNADYFFANPIYGTGVHIRSKGTANALCGMALDLKRPVDLSGGICGDYLCAECEGRAGRDKPQNPAPDWDKIKKLAQRMSGLVDEIEKEIESGE